MAQLQKFTTDLDVIQKHGDNPNTDNGLSAAALRAEFDKSGNLIKDWINTYLIPAFNALDNGKLSKGELTQAINKALEQAKESGQFDGVSPTITITEIPVGHLVTITDAEGSKSFIVADGKSAYQYARDGGYAGTETEFAEKLSQATPATLPNPKSLIFTGGATGTYDGSQEITVNIPIGGGSMEVDATLSVSGKAADAKAAGDALAGKLNANQGASNAGKILGIVKGGVVTPVDAPEAGTVDLDTTLSVSGKAADAKAAGDALSGKLNANQGTANAGKYLGIGSDGVIMPVLAPSGGAGGVTSVNGMSGNVTLPVPILGTCSTGASDATKVIAITGASGDTPVIVSGTVLRVKFSNANTASGIKLSVPGVPNQYPVIDSSMEGAVAPNTIGNRIHTFVFTSGAWVLLDPANASGTVDIDTTLSLSGKAADAKAAGDALAGKLNANQGTANAGKYLGIGSDGAVTPVEAPAGGGSGESDWRLIKDITVESDVKSVSVNSDYNGAGFSCREIYILSNAVNKSDQTSATYLKLDFNGKNKYDGNNNQHPYVTFGKTGESGRNWFWVKSINPLILLHGKWVTTNSTQGNTVQCIQQHINDAVPNPFAEGEKIESIGISGGMSSSYIASGSRILIYGR